MRAPPKAWKSKSALLKLLRSFLVVFGGLWLLLEPLALWRPDDLRWGLLGYAILISISVIVAGIWVWPRISITRKLPFSDTKITIAVGDILQQTGNIIIGFTDTFDTEIGLLISAKSIQGQFQAQIFPQQGKLDQAITNALQSETHQTDSNKLEGKKERYPIGTIAMIEAKDNRYFLSAYSQMKGVRADSDICMLQTSLNKCWEKIRDLGQHEPVHIGIVGSGCARIGLSRHLLLQFIILSFLDAEKKRSLTKEFAIHIYKDDIEHIDFVDLESWISGLTRAV